MLDQEVVDGFSANIILLDAVIKSYDNNWKDLGPSETFQFVRRQVSSLTNLLQTCEKDLESLGAPLTAHACTSLKETLLACKERTQRLRDMFVDVVVPDEVTTWDNRYAEFTKRFATEKEVEELMALLFTDVRRIVNHYVANNVTAKQSQELKSILEQMESGQTPTADDPSADRFRNGASSRVRITTTKSNYAGNIFIESDSERTGNTTIIKGPRQGYEINEDGSNFRHRVGMVPGQASYVVNECFVGRRRELDEMVKILRPSQISESQRSLTLSGMAGIGKTKLALAYELAFFRSYSAILWLNADSEGRLKSSCRSLVKRIFNHRDEVLEHEDVAEILGQWLCDPNNGNWLLIFDNYHPNKFRIDHCYPRVSHGAVVVTTRSTTIVTSETILVRPFREIEDSLAILRNITEREYVESDVHAKELANQIGGHPLILTAVGEYFRNSGRTFEQVLKEHDNQIIGLCRSIRLEERLDLPLNEILDTSHIPVEGEDTKQAGEQYQDDIWDSSSISSLDDVQSTALTMDIRNPVGDNTVTESNTAIHELVTILMDDEEMTLLYAVHHAKLRIATPNYIRNVRRLLNRFAMGLREEAREANDIHLANFVSTKVVLIAEDLTGRFEQQYSQTNIVSLYPKKSPVKNNLRTAQNQELRDASTDDDDGYEMDRSPNESLVSLISRGRGFIEGSTALQKARDELKEFLRQSRPTGSGDPVGLTIQGTPITVSLGRSSQASLERWLSWRWMNPFLWERIYLGLGRDFVRQREYETRQWTAGWLAKKYALLRALLSRTGILEEPMVENHQRLRWTNRHGKRLFDDYVEHNPGALEKLQQYLLTTTVYLTPTNEGTTTSQDQTASRAASMYTPNARSTSAGIPTSRGTTTQPTHSSSDCRPAIAQGSKGGQPSTSSLLLLSCIEGRGHPIKLHQELVTHVTDDRELFHSLRKIYYGHRKKFRSLFSLRTLHSIHFMKFGYGGHGLIDVRCHPEPCDNGKLCDCIPPAHRVLPQGKEYACQPIPPNLSPPIGPHAMMDFFKDPDSRVAGADWILQQLPKRIGPELDTNRPDMLEAWGIFYREDWDWLRIWAVLGFAFFPPSLLFGVLWGMLKQDIQGAFGIASWWMTGATIAVGIVATCT